MSEETPHEACARLAAPSNVLSNADLDLCRRLCEGSKLWLRQRALQFIAARSEEPLLQQSSADGTPINTRFVFTKTLDHLQVVRHARQTAEYLVQRVVLMSADGQARAVFRDPVEMSNKTASAHMRAAMELFPCAREVGHTDLLVEHRVFDRAVMSAMKKLWDQWAAAHSIHPVSTVGENAAFKLDLYHWRSMVGCFGHDCHGGLKWGIFEYLQNKQTVKDAYIAVESLRNGYGVLSKNIVPWAKSCLRQEDSTMDYRSRCTLWSLLGVSGEWLDIILQLELRYENGHLLVSSSCVVDEALYSRIEVVLLKLFHFHKFTDSRWVTLGCAGRSILCGLMTGWQELETGGIGSARVSTHG